MRNRIRKIIISGREIADEKGVRLSRLLPLAGSFCEYRYDLGDNRRHQILLESIVCAAPRKRYPVCVAGARSGPPEDVSGTGGFERYLEALSDPQHEDYEDMLAWRGRFDPEQFSITSINQRLREVFPIRSRPGNKPAAKPRKPAALVSQDEFRAIVTSLIWSGRPPEMKRIEVAPDERIPVPLAARDRELLVEHSFADPSLIQPLQIAPEGGKSQIFYFTLDELDDLIGCVAAEANHAGKRARKEWDRLYEQLAILMDGYRQSR